MHFSDAKIYDTPWSDRAQGKAGVLVNQRTEALYLNRNIKIEGDQSTPTQLSGHVMITHTAKGYFSNVEFGHLGKMGVLGRYPIHWHLARDVTGQYVRNCAIHHSRNRCISIHGTNGLVFQDNTCYDHLGHGVFLEDGGENGNLIDGNVVAVTRRPPDEFQILATDNRTVSSYW
jgi:cell migration-inducing and hyaluronan-binding protein